MSADGSPFDPTRVDTASENAAGVGTFAYLRTLERKAGKRPRIGRNERLRDSLVRLGQDPFLNFADRDMARLEEDAPVPVARPYFIGFFGPFGALPLNWTEEVRRWFDGGDGSFTAFCDIFGARFQELYFRAWSDTKAITQFDHPTDDRFQTYLLSTLGIGTPAFRDRDELSDTVKLRLAPLAAGRVRSPVRLRQMLELHFGEAISVDVEEFVPSWLEFEPDSLSCLGTANMSLGQNVALGSRTRSLGERVRLHIRVPTLARYRQFLPGGTDHAHLKSIVAWYLGQTFDVEVALWLPEPQVTPAKLGESVELGWMACIAPVFEEGHGPWKGAEYRLAPLGDIEGRVIKSVA